MSLSRHRSNHSVRIVVSFHMSLMSPLALWSDPTFQFNSRICNSALATWIKLIPDVLIKVRSTRGSMIDGNQLLVAFEFIVRASSDLAFVAISKFAVNCVKLN